MKVDRHLKDRAMDRIDHALGRPLDPMTKSYRNFYSTEGDEADEMAASPLWVEGWPTGSYRCFSVTDAGRKALAEHLKDIGDPHRAFTVTFDGHSSLVVAVSASKARYSHYLDVSDTWSDLKFKDYCRRTSVKSHGVCTR